MGCLVLGGFRLAAVRHRLAAAPGQPFTPTFLWPLGACGLTEGLILPVPPGLRSPRLARYTIGWVSGRHARIVTHHAPTAQMGS